MKKIFFYTLCIFIAFNISAQETILPALPQKETIALTNATIHVGNGQVINNGTVVFKNGKITEVGATASTAGAKLIDCKGKHIYPGLILTASQLGLIEVPSNRATVDGAEIGEMNPSIRSLVAYNTDSKVTNTLRTNGILLANVIPDGGVISGSSSVVQLDAWNWEDAAYKTDVAIHFRMPSLLNRRGGRGGFGGQQAPADPVKTGLEQIEKVKVFFREAKAYLAESKHENTNLKFEAVKNLFDKKQKLFIHCNIVKEMLIAVDFVKEFNAELDVLNVDYHNKHFKPETPEQSALLHTLLEEANPFYHFIEHADIEDGINEFAEKNNLDLIITIPKKHRLLDSVFKTSSTKQLVYQSHVPVMCVHE